MNISAYAYRAIFQTLLFLLFIAISESALSQVVIRERVPIRPSTLQSSIASTGYPASEAYVVAPSDGTMQITGLYADQAEATIPQNARLVTTSPLVQRSDSIWSYCSSRYYGPWHAAVGWYGNTCTQSIVNVNAFSTVEGFDRTIFFPVHEGDTVRFAYWSRAWIDRCEVSSGGNPWSIHLFRSSDCYSCDSISVWIHLSYADSGFANLHVQALRDTVVYMDSLKNSTPIAVVARSTLGREVQVNDGLLVNFRVDSVGLAKFISPAGDTVASPLNNVSYANARNGKVKIVASRSPRDSLVNIGVSAALVSDPSKSGVDSICFVRSRPRLRFVDKNPRKLWPYIDSRVKGADRPGYNAKRGCMIEVLSANGNPLSNQYISLQTSFVAKSGGHGHSHSGDTVMQWSLQGKFWAQGKNGNPLLGRLKTGSDGRVTVDSFRTSPFSGTFVLWAWLNADTTVYDSVEIKVQVDSLVEFGPDSSWLLTGVPGEGNHGLNHPSNHWCLQKAKDTLTFVLGRFYEWTKTAEGGGSGIRVGVNDMSLQTGGVFDIEGSWADGHHKYHRVGLSADFNRSGMTNSQLDQLEKMMKKKRAYRNSERPEIHFGFSGGH